MNELEINCKRYNGQLYGKQQLLNQQWCCLRFGTHWHSNEIVFHFVRMAYQILTMTGLAFPPISILIMPRVFGLLQDSRNHPTATHMALGLPVVLSSDNPALWKSSPISHGFYEAFMGFTGGWGDMAHWKRAGGELQKARSWWRCDIERRFAPILFS